MPQSEPLPGNSSRPASGRAAQLAFLQAAAANGIVEVHECACRRRTGRADLAALLALDGPVTGPRLPRRPRSAIRSRPGSCWPQTGAHALGGDLTVDGAIGSRTAALHRSVHRCPGGIAASGT